MRAITSDLKRVYSVYGWFFVAQNDSYLEEQLRDYWREKLQKAEKSSLRGLDSYLADLFEGSTKPIESEGITELTRVPVKYTNFIILEVKWRGRDKEDRIGVLKFKTYLYIHTNDPDMLNREIQREVNSLRYKFPNLNNPEISIEHILPDRWGFVDVGSALE